MRFSQSELVAAANCINGNFRALFPLHFEGSVSGPDTDADSAPRGILCLCCGLEAMRASFWLNSGSVFAVFNQCAFIRTAQFPVGRSPAFMFYPVQSRTICLVQRRLVFPKICAFSVRKTADDKTGIPMCVTPILIF